MPSDPLRIQFAHSAALIYCDDQALIMSLRHHLRHCIGATASVVATYRVATDEGSSVQLRRDDEVFFCGPQSPYLILHLIRALTKALTARCPQHLVLHAAGLACGESGLILCGEQGSGKSTIAAWLTGSGLDFLTDEVVAVPYDLGNMIGLPRPIQLKPGSAFVWQHWLDATARQSLARFPDGSVLLDPDLLRSGCVRATVSPQFLLFPRYAAGGHFEVQRLSPAMALFRLMQRSASVGHLRSQQFVAATRLARQTTAYGLTYGDVTSVAAWIRQICTPPR